LLRLLTMWLLLRLRSGSVAVLLSLPSGADLVSVAWFVA